MRKRAQDSGSLALALALLAAAPVLVALRELIVSGALVFFPYFETPSSQALFEKGATVSASGPSPTPIRSASPSLTGSMT